MLDELEETQMVCLSFFVVETIFLLLVGRRSLIGLALFLRDI